MACVSEWRERVRRDMACVSEWRERERDTKRWHV